MAQMIEINEIIQKHKLPPDSLEITTLKVEELTRIFDDHASRTHDLETVGDLVTSQLRRVSQVHSPRYRVKEPEHLVAKIIRKRIESPKCIISFEDYRDQITDLIGIRVLHLFKEDWQPIHDYIDDTWDLKEQSVANFRDGDSKEWLAVLEERGCRINAHKAGYRSVHYVLQCQPTKTATFVEVQVRTALLHKSNGITLWHS